MQYLKSIFPDSITIYLGDKSVVCLEQIAGELNHADVKLRLSESQQGLKVAITSQTTSLRTLKLRWNLAIPFAESAIFSGDCWERTYGSLHWENIDASRDLPWFFLMNNQNENFGMGVKTGGGSFANFMIDSKGISLYFDLRSGCGPSLPGGRMIEAGEIVSFYHENCTSFQAMNRLAVLMAPNYIKLPDTPVYGFNNWYYAYGKSSHDDIINDTRFLMELCHGNPYPPYMVIDDGWEINSCCGPWDCGNKSFPNMKHLATEIASLGAKPGLWFRPLKTKDENALQKYGFNREFSCLLDPPATNVLDPSYPEVLELVKADIRRFGEWGYKLVKHDFSTYDCFSENGCHIYRFPGIHPNKWSFHDTSRTSAEILKGLYQAIAEAAAEYDILIIGCNVIGHLAAGLAPVVRVGDDTSGQYWEPNRKNGINSLAFRLPLHGKFYLADADCLGITGANTPNWEINRQWGELLSKSNTPFFASIKPGVLSDEQLNTVKDFMKQASQQHQPAIPLNWQNDRTPSRWELDGQPRQFNWYEANGNNQDFLV